VYKLYSLNFKCLRRANPQYLEKRCMPVTASVSRHQLRSAAQGDLQVLATRTVTFGLCSFSSCAPLLWNNLLPLLSTLTLTQFCSKLKIRLFTVAYGRALVTVEAVRTACYVHIHPSICPLSQKVTPGIVFHHGQS